VGDPQRRYAVVHIGGTNGKGSTAAFTAAMLRATGLRVGLYTSPHLVSFTERIVVDGVPIAEEAVAAWTARLRPLAEEREASFFEITTAIAFADFAARGVEVAVVEVGLGGRLDATSIVEPLACGVTRIALEHTDYLGDTLEAIAREKAGIAKPGVPLFTTEMEAGLVDVMRDVVERTDDGGPGTGGLRVVDPALAAGYRLGLAGPHQVANASLALALVAALPERYRPDAEAVAAGLSWARIPGRFDRRGRWLFDVAHNPDGMHALVAAIRAGDVPRPLWAVVAVLRDKAWREMLDILAPAVDGIVVTRAPSAPVERAWELEAVRDEARTVRDDTRAVEVVPDLAEALRSARDRAATVLVTGSFHTVGDAMTVLGVDPVA
jgi:dihydrofolate synthase/folylpolyglutamate synthase